MSDRIVEAINTGDPGYAPKINVVSAADEAPQPTFIVDDGKYKLTDGAEDDPLGFAFDAFGNKFSAKIKYYPYDATNDVNDANLDLPPGYGAKENGFTRAEVEAGIDKSFYDTNYPGVDIVWKRYSWDPDSLGASSEIITFTDTTPPVANTQPYTATLDANGNATLSFADIDNGSSDDSGTYSVVAFSPTSVDCSDTGSITASYTLEDPSGNQTSGTETVNVVDNTAPSLTTQNVAGFIDASGNYVANPTSFVQTATDACGIASSTLNNTNFSCSDLGVNTIQVTVTDNNGNQTTKPANLTLSDNINPEIPANLAVVGETSASISLNWSATSDNCSVSKYKIYRNGSYRATINAPTTSFTDTGLAPETTYNYTIISVDGSNNESASSGSVSGTTEVATDTEAPTAPTVTVSDVTDTSFNLTSQGSTDNVGVTATEFYLDENIDGMPNGTLVYTSTASQPVNYEFTDLDADTTYEAYARTTDFAGNASAFSNVEQVQTTIGIEERETKGLKVYPNPANEHLTISIDGQLDDIEIYNLQGQLIKEFDPQGASKTDINVNDLSKGMYLLHIWDKAGQRSVRKIVKN